MAKAEKFFMGSIDYPPHRVAEWERFKAEMQRLPQTPDVKRHIRTANAAIKLLKQEIGERSEKP